MARTRLAQFLVRLRRVRPTQRAQPRGQGLSRQPTTDRLRRRGRASRTTSCCPRSGSTCSTTVSARPALAGRTTWPPRSRFRSHAHPGHRIRGSRAHRRAAAGWRHHPSAERRSDPRRRRDRRRSALPCSRRQPRPRRRPRHPGERAHPDRRRARRRPAGVGAGERGRDRMACLAPHGTPGESRHRSDHRRPRRRQPRHHRVSRGTAFLFPRGRSGRVHRRVPDRLAWNVGALATVAHSLALVTIADPSVSYTQAKDAAVAHAQAVVQPGPRDPQPLAGAANRFPLPGAGLRAGHQSRGLSPEPGSTARRHLGGAGPQPRVRCARRPRARPGHRARVAAHLPVAATAVPTLFRLGIHNGGATEQIYNLSFDASRPDSPRRPALGACQSRRAIPRRSASACGRADRSAHRARTPRSPCG